MLTAIIVAGGTGERFGSSHGKQLVEIAGRPLLAHTVDACKRCDAIQAIVVVCHPDRVDEYRSVVCDPGMFTKIVAVVAGGETRMASVAAGMRALPPDADPIAVHDGARPLVPCESVSSAVEALEADPALDGVVIGHPSYDTIKRVNDDGFIIDTPNRSELWVAQTPQIFRRAVLEDAYAQGDMGQSATDDAALVESIGGRIRMLEGPRDNIKVTVAEDASIAASLIEQRLCDTHDAKESGGGRR